MNRLSAVFSAALLVGCSLLFSSCVYWNIGSRLSEQGETRRGADIAHPVDGLLYGGRYMFAPEVEYVPRTPIISAGEHEMPSLATKVRRTGRVVVAEVEFPKKGGARFVRALRSMPADAQGLPFTRNLPATSRTYGTTVSNRTESGRYFRGASAPFTYVVDPVLSVFSTPIYWIYSGGRFMAKRDEGFRWVPFSYPRVRYGQR